MPFLQPLQDHPPPPNIEAHMSSNHYSPYHAHTQAPPPMSLHLWLFLFIVFISLGFSWYMRYESVLESLVDQLRLAIMVLPLVLLLAVHWLSSSDGRWVPFLIRLPERESIHRAGGSPWGVGLLLVVLIFMISHQSYFHDRWFPLRSRW